MYDIKVNLNALIKEMSKLYMLEKEINVIYNIQFDIIRIEYPERRKNAYELSYLDIKVCYYNYALFFYLYNKGWCYCYSHSITNFKISVIMECKINLQQVYIYLW